MPATHWGVLLMTVLSSALPGLASADEKRAEEIVAGRCALCHGKNGEAASAVYPRLAGQHAEYIARQLGDFKSGKRASDTMKPQAESLTPDEMAALGKYFESRKVGGRKVQDAELLAVGKFIYSQGNRFSGVPACASCHGPLGHGTAQLPRLAGQHPRYVADQLQQFSKRERTNDNAVMHSVAAKLSELEAHAVAAYVATLE